MSQAPTVEEAGFTVSAVARRLGIAPSTLRTWDRRYGLAPSLRTAGSHRRYTAGDLELLEAMRSHMAAGMAPGDAARAARTGSDSHGAVSAPAEAGAGQAPLRTAAHLQRALDRAAATMDAAAVTDIIRSSIEQSGVVWAWEEVVAPVLRLIGERYEKGGKGEAEGVDIEHHFSHVIMRELIRHSEVRDARNPRPVLLAAAPDELHTLPLYALAAALAERGIMSQMLGGRTPEAALCSAIRRVGPVAVFIWAQSRPAIDLSVSVPAIRPQVEVFVGGPGWQFVEADASVRRPRNLHEAVSQLAAAARVGEF